MKEKMQNIIGGIVLIIIIILLISLWLIIGGNKINSEDNGIILTPLEVTADPAAYTGIEIKVEGVVINTNQGDSSFLIMPIDIYIQCDRNAYCGEEYTHLKVSSEGRKLPSFEHDVIVTGNLNKITDETYVLLATNIKDKGRI